MSKFCLAVLALAMIAGCAAPADRTKQLLELDLAHRAGAIESLQNQQQADPRPWRAYSLGVLYGADHNYEIMNRWFESCRSLGNTHNQDIEFVRLGHWRDEARAADQAATNNDWPLAVIRLEKALLAAPEKKETRLRLVEARIMAFGPGREEIRTLVTAEHPEAVYRWLEQSTAATEAGPRLEARVRLGSQLAGRKLESVDALAVYVAGELCRLDGDWENMDRHYRQATALEPANIDRNRQVMTTRRQVASGLLQQSLARWSEDRVPAALAKLDTADLVDPDRADVFQARRNIIALDRARTGSQVAETLAVGDLDQRWLTFWMSRLYTKGRLRDAGMVADDLLRHSRSLAQHQKSQALRVRVAFSRSTGNLDQARDDLRELLSSSEPLPTEAVILGDVLLAQSRYEEARHWFDKARGWGDKSVSVVLKQARIAFSQDRFPEMVELATLATELDPDNREAGMMLMRAKALVTADSAVVKGARK